MLSTYPAGRYPPRNWLARTVTGATIRVACVYAGLR
jgi:hypothetical protein